MGGASSDSFWGDNCLSDDWYIANNYEDHNFRYCYNANVLPEGSDNWINYKIKSTRYNNPGFWHSSSGNWNEGIPEEVLNDTNFNDIVNGFSYALGEYFNGENYKWERHDTCSPQAKFERTSDGAVVYFHDIDNAVRFSYNAGGTLVPFGDAKIDGMVLGSDAWMPEGSSSDTWVLKDDLTLDLSEATSDTWTLDKDIIVPAGKTLTVKKGTLDLNGKFDVKGSLVICAGAVVEAGTSSSDSWAITTGENANVTVNGQLNAATKGIWAAKGTNVTIDGTLNAGVDGIKADGATVTINGNGAVLAERNGIEANFTATKPVKGQKVPTITVNGEIEAGGYGINAEGYNIDVKGDIEAANDGINAADCIVKIAGAAGTSGGSDSWATVVSTNEVKAQAGSDSWCGVKLNGSSKLNAEAYSKIKGKPGYGLEIDESSVANLKGGVVKGSEAAILQNGAKTKLNITSGIIVGGQNAIDVRDGFFSINAENKTRIISKKKAAIIIAKSSSVVPSITATSDAWLKVEAPNGKDAVSVDPSDSWFWGGFISAGKYSKDVNDKYIKQGYQDVRKSNDSDTWYEVVPCNVLTNKNVSLDTYVVNYANDKTKRPEVTVTINGESVPLSENFVVTYEGDKQVGKAKVTVTARSDKYKGTVVKYYYVKGPVTPSSITAPGEAGRCTVYVVGNYFVYNGQKIRPMVVVKNGAFTVNPTEYKVEYSGNTDVGTAEVKVTSYAQKTVATQEATIKPAFEGVASFEILPRDLYVIPNSYTKKKTAGSDTWTLDSKAYGYVLKDAADINGFISELSYKLTDAAGSPVGDNIVTERTVDGDRLKPGVYQIAIEPEFVANVEESPGIMGNYKVIPATGKLIVLDANDKAPVVEYKTTGNSLVDMINKAIKTATDKIAVEIKVDVDVPIIDQLENAVKKAQELWDSINKKLAWDK